VGAEAMLGYDAIDVVDRITPADLSDPQELVKRAEELSTELSTTIAPGFEALVFKAKRGIEDIYELTYVRKDGSRFPAVVSVTALRDAQDDIIGYLLIGTDNTAGKEVEAAQALLDQQLRDQHFYTRSLIESNIDALMTTDPQGTITDVNQQMMTLTGSTREELIGVPFRDFFTDPVRADEGIARVLTEHKVSDYELTARARNGDETFVSYNAATFHDRDHNLKGVFAAARDVTDRRRIESTLQERNVQLEHASRMKSEFLATMSHELRTPLNSVIGFSEALKDGLIGEMSESQQDYIGDIFTSGQHLLSLINDILNFAKIEAGQLRYELERVPVAALLADLEVLVTPQVAQRGLSYRSAAGEGGLAVWADEEKTRQILLNLVTNAIKFTEPGGAISVSYHRADRGVRIRVTDTGRGIAPEQQARIFDPFVQVDRHLTAESQQGVGLGLAISRDLARGMGGDLHVSSVPGEGSTFTLWLPTRGQE
jgi:PAS domain S-box-containing protein